MSDYASDAELAVISDDSKASRSQRLAAVWAHAKDLAAEKYPENEVMGFFTAPRGNVLMAELQAMPLDTRVGAMLDAARKHLGIEVKESEPETKEAAPSHE